MAELSKEQIEAAAGTFLDESEATKPDAPIPEDLQSEYDEAAIAGAIYTFPKAANRKRALIERIARLTAENAELRDTWHVNMTTMQAKVNTSEAALKGMQSLSDSYKSNYGAALEREAVLLGAVTAKDAEIDRLREQIPAPGDGSCDHCGKVPSVDIPTSLCDDCRDGVRRAETAEAVLRDQIRNGFELAIKNQKAHDELRAENARLRAALEEKNAENAHLSEALKKMASEPCSVDVEKFGYVQRGQSLFRPDQVKLLLDARLRAALSEKP